jgi:hypothetical protein
MFSDRGSYSGESVYRNNEAGPVGWMKKRLEKKVHDFLSFNPFHGRKPLQAGNHLPYRLPACRKTHQKLPFL